MAVKLMSEEAVKQELNLKNFRNIPKDKVIEFVSMMHNIDPEVAIRCIEQFPKFIDSSKEIIHQLSNTCKDVIESGNKSRKDAANAYQQVLFDLEEELNKKHISRRERKYIIEKMVEVADKIAELDKQHKAFLLTAFKGVGQAAMFVVAAGAGMLGLKFFEKH